MDQYTAIINTISSISSTNSALQSYIDYWKSYFISQRDYWQSHYDTIKADCTTTTATPTTKEVPTTAPTTESPTITTSAGRR